jgi:hypothetical protein
MRARTLTFLAIWLFVVGPNAAPQSAVDHPNGPVTDAQNKELFDRVITHQKKSDQALDVYERIERVETRKTGSDAQPVSVKVTRVIPSGTGMRKIAMGPDGKPTDAVLYRAELESLEKALMQAAEPARSQREGLEKYAKKKKERLEVIESTRNAFLYTYVAEETRDGRTLSKYRMEPNPAYRPTTRMSSIFAKVRGFVWVDEAAGELARVDGEVTEDISLGLFLAKVYKGSHFMQERYEMVPGMWFASFSQYDFDGRKFFSGFSIHERTFYSHYKYVGPPKEALVAIRAELGKAPAVAGDP